MKFSVLMSVYVNDNVQALIEALESLKNQSLPADEVVIVCDGPVSNELNDVLTCYKKLLPMKLVYLDINVGLGAALNHGIKIVSNEWVFRMDSDDICLTNRFESQIEVIKKNPNLDVVGGWIEEFEKSPGDIKSYRKVPESNKFIYSSLSRYSPFNHVTVAFKKKSVLDVGSYMGGKNFQEDYYLWLRMAVNNYEFYNLPVVLVHVRAGDAMLGRRSGWQYYKNEMFINYFGFRNGLMSRGHFVTNIIIKFFTRMSPLMVRKLVYKTARSYINKKEE